jgi:hypothetical protein
MRCSRDGESVNAVTGTVPSKLRRDLTRGVPWNGTPVHNPREETDKRRLVAN